MSMNTTTHRETESTPRSGVNRDQVAQRAYQLWEAAGRPAGRDLEYWLQAESEIHSASHSHSPKAAVSGNGPKRESAGEAAPSAQSREAENPGHKAVSLLAGGSNEPRDARPGGSRPRTSASATGPRFSGGM